MPRRSPPKRPPVRRRGASPATALVLAICHEVGNLLAASRLSAHLLPRSGEEERGMAEALEDLAAQAGWLLSNVRPLLADDPKSRIRVAPSAVLDAVARALRDGSGAASPEVQIPKALPEVQLDPDALHHVLLTLVRSGREAAKGDKECIVSARRSGGSVVFTVRDAAVRSPAPRSSRSVLPRGRALALEIARALAAREGGRMTTHETLAGSEIALAFPVVAVRRARPRRRPRPRSGKWQGRSVER